jgi:four helix bundle protein
MSATRCRSCGQRGFCDCGLRIVNCRMTTQELKDRTFKFAIWVVRAVEALPKNDTSRVLGRQLLRAGTSVGAKYRSAARARSHADFIAKLGIVEEERDEASYWMEVIVALKLLKKTRLESLRKEADELLAIVVSSFKTARRPRRR